MCVGFAISSTPLSLCGLFIPVGMIVNIIINTTKVKRA
jgi:hypothetical protein